MCSSQVDTISQFPPVETFPKLWENIRRYKGATLWIASIFLY